MTQAQLIATVALFQQPEPTQAVALLATLLTQNRPQQLAAMRAAVVAYRTSVQAQRDAVSTSPLDTLLTDIDANTP